MSAVLQCLFSCSSHLYISCSSVWSSTIQLPLLVLLFHQLFLVSYSFLRIHFWFLSDVLRLLICWSSFCFSKAHQLFIFWPSSSVFSLPIISPQLSYLQYDLFAVKLFLLLLLISSYPFPHQLLFRLIFINSSLTAYQLFLFLLFNSCSPSAYQEFLLLLLVSCFPSTYQLFLLLLLVSCSPFWL